MSDFEFERADRDVINMVRENRRRSGITRTVGVIVPLDEARKAVVGAAVRNRDTSGAGSFALMALALLVIVVVSVGVLA